VFPKNVFLRQAIPRTVFPPETVFQEKDFYEKSHMPIGLAAAFDCNPTQKRLSAYQSLPVSVRRDRIRFSLAKTFVLR
jgi:hypothetical protein